jgi:hypothetical protein
MPATSGTRRGNGPGRGGPAKGGGAGDGWAGPAQGAGVPFKPGNAGRPEGIANGEGRAARARAALEDAVPLAIQTVVSIAGNLEDQRALAAALSILNRTGLHEKSGVEVGGEGGGPVVVVKKLFVGSD